MPAYNNNSRVEKKEWGALFISGKLEIKDASILEELLITEKIKLFRNQTNDINNKEVLRLFLNRADEFF